MLKIKKNYPKKQKNKITKKNKKRILLKSKKLNTIIQNEQN